MPSIQEFEAIIPRLATSDHEFANSLLGHWKRGPLSFGRQHWVGKLMERAARPVVSTEPVQVAGIGRIRLMFDTAASRLKYPKIWLGTPDAPIRLSVAGAKSRTPGSIMVTDGGPFGSNRYYGAIDRTGSMKPGRDLTAEVTRELAELSANPEAKAAAFGRLTGCCCFCNTALTDDRSTSVGYGPVCAKNFGLNWGARAT